MERWSERVSLTVAMPLASGQSSEGTERANTVVFAQRSRACRSVCNLVTPNVSKCQSLVEHVSLLFIRVLFAVKDDRRC